MWFLCTCVFADFFETPFSILLGTGLEVGLLGPMESLCQLFEELPNGFPQQGQVPFPPTVQEGPGYCAAPGSDRLQRTLREVEPETLASGRPSCGVSPGVRRPLLLPSV